MNRRERRAWILRWLAALGQVGGLAATAWVVWFASLERRPLEKLLGNALRYALPAWAASAAIALAVFLVMPRTERRMTLRAFATAVWLAPAIILLSAYSALAIPAAVVLVISASRILYFHWCPGSPDGEPEMRLQLAAAAAIQGGLVAALMQYPLLAGALAALGIAIVTVLADIAGLGESQPTLPRSILAVLLTLILSLGVAGVGVTGGGSSERREFAPPGQPDILQSVRGLLQALLYGFQPDRPKQEMAEVQVPPPEETADLPEGGYPGVILWPEVKPETTLVAPLYAPGGGVTGRMLAAPFSIPFGGEYWMFKPPFMRPPLRSFKRRGSPLALSFVTTDRRPMYMEAHHKLDEPIDLSCCSQIRVVLHNADRYPGSVSLELILLNSRSPGWQSLGRVPVTAFPDARKTPLSPVWQTLDFAIPATPRLLEFDEFKVVFHRDRGRADRSARISIERFVLVPRVV